MQYEATKPTTIIPESDVLDQSCEISSQGKLERLLASNFKEPKPKKQKRVKVIPLDLHDKQLYEQAYKRKTTLSQPMHHVKTKFKRSERPADMNPLSESMLEEQLSSFIQDINFMQYQSQESSAIKVNDSQPVSQHKQAPTNKNNQGSRRTLETVVCPSSQMLLERSAEINSRSNEVSTSKKLVKPRPTLTLS